jgi:tripeptidyl-peptidase-1
MNFFPEISAYNPNNGFASGSGFSNYFSRPSYQEAAVKKYLSGIGNLYKGLYNHGGRAYPDISAQGFHYRTVWDGRVVGLDGTSASMCSPQSLHAKISVIADIFVSLRFSCCCCHHWFG